MRHRRRRLQRQRRKAIEAFRGWDMTWTDVHGKTRPMGRNEIVKFEREFLKALSK